jgi:hypothetical protein
MRQRDTLDTHRVEVQPGYLVEGSYVVEVETMEGPVVFGVFKTRLEADNWAYHFTGSPKVIEITVPTFNRG